MHGSSANLDRSGLARNCCGTERFDSSGYEFRTGACNAWLNSGETIVRNGPWACCGWVVYNRGQWDRRERRHLRNAVRSPSRGALGSLAWGRYGLGFSQGTLDRRLFTTGRTLECNSNRTYSFHLVELERVVKSRRPLVHHWVAVRSLKKGRSRSGRCGRSKKR